MRRAGGRRFFSAGEADGIDAPLRARYIELFEQAAEAGADHVERLFDLTPREITWRLAALNARGRERDELAWMTAQYVALAVHAPDKLPPRPALHRAKSRQMSDQEMKSRLLAWAGREIP